MSRQVEQEGLPDETRQEAVGLAQAMIAKGRGLMWTLLEIRRPHLLSESEALSIYREARGITAEEHEAELAAQKEAWLPGSQPPMFPRAPDWIPSWCIRLNGGELNKADQGRTVYIDFFHMTKDVLHFKTEDSHFQFDEETVPEQIEKGYARARRDIEKMWGAGRPTYIVPPDFQEAPMAPGNWSTPRYRCFAWLSATALDDEKHGSHAFLIWWQEGGSCGMKDYDPTVDTPNALEAVTRILEAVPWETIAAEFYI